MAKKQKTMIPENLVKRLINTYVECIEKTEDGDLEFEGTIYNFAQRIVDTMEKSQQKSVFGATFDSYDECYDFLELYVPSLRDELEKYLLD